MKNDHLNELIDGRKHALNSIKIQLTDMKEKSSCPCDEAKLGKVSNQCEHFIDSVKTIHREFDSFKADIPNMPIITDIEWEPHISTPENKYKKFEPEKNTEFFSIFQKFIGECESWIKKIEKYNK